MAQETTAKTSPPPDQMTLVLERTYLAHERTLMAVGMLKLRMKPHADSASDVF